jgi:hypothetical protein
MLRTSPNTGHRHPIRAATPPARSPRRRCGSKPEYRVPAEHHNPMESFGATVVRHDDGTLAVYDKTQGVLNVREYLPLERVRLRQG